MPLSDLDRLGMGNAFGGILGGMFGHSDRPYEAAGQQYQQYANQGRQYQQPFFQAGQQAIPQYQNWLQSQKDPSGFINNLMGGYQESPHARYLQQQAMRAGVNAASMGGLPNGMGGAGIGSTPFLQQSQQNAANISSQDMNQWLQNVLGINQQYGQGQQNLMTGGQNAANQISTGYNQLGQNMAESEYGREAGRNQDKFNLFGGLGSLIGMFL